MVVHKTRNRRVPGLIDKCKTLVSGFYDDESLKDFSLLEKALGIGDKILVLKGYDESFLDIMLDAALAMEDLRALNYAEKLHTINPNDDYLDSIDMCDALGGICLKHGSYNEAIVQFSSAILKGDATPSSFIGRATAHMSLGNYDFAIADFEQAMYREVNQVQEIAVLGGLTLCYAKLKDMKTAYFYRDKLGDISPEILEELGFNKFS